MGDPGSRKLLALGFYVALAYVLLFLFVEVVGTVAFLKIQSGG